MSAGPSPWSEARHVLGVRLDNMGDVLMSTPALRALRAPGRRISLLTSSAGAALAPHLADVDDVLAYDASWVKREGASADGDRQAIERLRELRPDAAVIFTVHSQSALPAALMLRLAGVPRVLAYSRENPYQLLTDWVSEPEPHRVRRHEVLRQLTLVRTVGATTDDTRLGFLVREIDRVGLRRKLSRLGVAEPGGWIAAHGGASAPSRRYPAERLAGALEALRGEGRRMLLLGGADEGGLGEALAARRQRLPGLIDLTGQLTLGELGAAIEGAAVLICNNSGPAHIAAALGVPVVDLYALTNPQHTPWQTPQRVLNREVPCRGCRRSVCPQGHHACLAGVEPREVADAARELLSARISR
ncbi:glycosyltransferase family 9 protein [Bordetella hinzii]|uniref:Glycosyltransferase family 9 protein n=1 Tax=Bordetella hinzii TaxID=103855 RepID=A0AAN1VH51_9BORD|nr:glycosyltransferase family 9 protein [Bordetella hinzii]AKQ60239.1 ADP-heptose--LPS heptosyltransferase 2 [Bordetella hinzii]AZW18689.1 glycosyltransferase family 9 protein [Bordetella hinzii]KCB50993.1 heptosyltransferase [Bordetella hinzii 1277]MBZ0077340.1 glycosyltransferase family 9 protein [Bordetella hinzii]MBZ0081723.1 glycosyltransferase family 9 protein [Bordetella hinzii]